MEKIHKSNVDVGFLCQDDKGNILEVTWYIFSDGITYKHGEPLPMNEVHVNIYAEKEDGSFELIEHQSFLNIHFMQPLTIKENYLRFAGFKEDNINGADVLRLGNVIFLKGQGFKGVNMAYNAKSDEVYPLMAVHEAQQLARVIK